MSREDLGQPTAASFSFERAVGIPSLVLPGLGCFRFVSPRFARPGSHLKISLIYWILFEALSHTPDT